MGFVGAYEFGSILGKFRGYERVHDPLTRLGIGFGKWIAIECGR